MNIEEEFRKFLRKWVEKMYGQNEAYNPSWSIKALAHDLREEYIKIKEREETEWVKEDVEYVANNHDIKLTDKQAYAVAQEYMLSEAYCEMHAEDILYFIQREKEKEKPAMTKEQLNTYKKLQELDGMMGTNKAQEYADGISKGNKNSSRPVRRKVMEQHMRYMDTKDMVIIDAKQRCMVVVSEGTGDNLLDEDVEQGYKDYAMLSLYTIDGDELALVDSGQMMTEKLIADMTEEEYAEQAMSYFDLSKDSKVIKL